MDAPQFGYQMLAFGGAAPVALTYPTQRYGHRTSGLRDMYGDGDSGETGQNDGYRTPAGKEGTAGSTRDLSYFNLTCESGVACLVSAVTCFAVQFTDGSGSDVSGGHTWTLTWQIAGVTVGTQSATGAYLTNRKALTTQETTAAQVLITGSMHTASDGNAGQTELFNYALDAVSLKEAAGGPEIVGHTLQIHPLSPNTGLTATSNLRQTAFTNAAGDGVAIKLHIAGFKDYYYRNVDYDEQRILVSAYFDCRRIDGSGGTRTVSLNVGGRGAVTASSGDDTFQTTVTTNFIENPDTAGETNIAPADIVLNATCTDGDGAYACGGAIFFVAHTNDV